MGRIPTLSSMQGLSGISALLAMLLANVWGTSSWARSPEAPIGQKSGSAPVVTAANVTFARMSFAELPGWVQDDHLAALKAALDELDVKIRETRKEARLAPNLPTKLDLQRQLRQLEAKRNEAWKEFDEASRNVERQKDGLLDEISQRLEQKCEQEELFVIRWNLV